MNNQQPSKAFLYLGIIAGAVMMLVGFVGLAYNLEPTSSFDIGYMVFGGDAYTYLSNNAYLAAAAAVFLVRLFCGFMVTFGIAIICFFGFKLSAVNKKAAVTAVPGVSSGAVVAAKGVHAVSAGPEAVAQGEER